MFEAMPLQSQVPFTLFSPQSEEVVRDGEDSRPVSTISQPGKEILAFSLLLNVVHEEDFREMLLWRSAVDRRALSDRHNIKHRTHERLSIHRASSRPRIHCAKMFTGTN